MPLTSNAQLFVIEPESNQQAQMNLIPLEVHDQHPDHSHHNHHNQLDVCDPEDITIIIDDLPGAPKDSKEPEEELEVSEDDKKDKSDLDDNLDAKPKKNPKWDWESKGAQGFVTWIKERIEDVPKHSGQDTSGLQRALAYMEKLDDEISRAMRLDLDGELNADKIEAVRSQIDDGIARLNDRLEKVKKHSKARRKKKADSDEDTDSIVKEAQKITGIQGTFVTVPLLISRLGRIIINGTISAGHDSSDMFKKLSTKYKLNDREQAELMQYLSDSGFPLREDRGYMTDEDFDESSSNNYDWAANFKA